MIKISRAIISIMFFGYAFLFIPILFIIVYSFSDSENSSVWTKFSLRWFKEVFDDEDFVRSLLNSLKIAGLSSFGAVLFGTFSAFATTHNTSHRRQLFLGNILFIPVVMPDIIVGFALCLLFVSLQPVFGLQKDLGISSVAVGHMVASMSYVHMTVRTRLQSFDTSIEEAALDLGAKNITVFLQITIPILINTLLAGWLLAFCLSLDDVVLASFLSGPGATSFPLLIFSNIRIGLSPMINAFSTIYITICSCLLLFSLKKRNYF